MIESRVSKLRRYKAQNLRFIVYALWIMIFILDIIFSKENKFLILGINSVILSILVCLEIYSKKK